MARPQIDEATVFSLEEAPKLLEKEDFEFFDDLVNRSREYLEAFRWCDRVVSVRVGIFDPGVLGVFLLEIETSRPDVDELIWVIMGDLPPAYIAEQNPGSCPNAACALDGYVRAMMDWVEAVEEGRSVAKLIPVNAPPTKEWAKYLRVRLEFIEQSILTDYKEFLT
ncbi:hypothetical protein [Pelagibius sp. Alg239-R121]|uniref:hypothetical protein n=1 Tax=Pelagibius sp. Alg239-R121 TaxID=2993448 RepID=UPI0024A67E84|nr:hypothetical protein [Pelagibius sp. Alg239-R121]